ncbi:MAG: hypothetical protein RMI91_01205 [Gemmatales bacterium]|nr:hypothetical protein [Gemmatales bacterium]MDW7993250.1 hypothetical protein [Gemmatales bacterium]
MVHNRFTASFTSVWLAGILLTFGCQSAPLGLHDPLVRGSVVPAEEARSYQSIWWSRAWSWWPFWSDVGKHSANPESNNLAARSVQPEEVTPATAWHVLNRLREEVERDLADPQN